MLIREYLGVGVDIVAVFGYSELKQGEIADELKYQKSPKGKSFNTAYSNFHRVGCWLIFYGNCGMVEQLPIAVDHITSSRSHLMVDWPLPSPCVMLVVFLQGNSGIALIDCRAYSCPDSHSIRVNLTRIRVAAQWLSSSALHT
jgi:hypothetical protein